jgi:hypothetical protein
MLRLKIPISPILRKQILKRKTRYFLQWANETAKSDSTTQQVYLGMMIFASAPARRTSRGCGLCHMSSGVSSHVDPTHGEGYAGTKLTCGELGPWPPYAELFLWKPLNNVCCLPPNWHTLAFNVPSKHHTPFKYNSWLHPQSYVCSTSMLLCPSGTSVVLRGILITRQCMKQCDTTPYCQTKLSLPDVSYSKANIYLFISFLLHCFYLQLVHARKVPTFTLKQLRQPLGWWSYISCFSRMCSYSHVGSTKRFHGSLSMEETNWFGGCI